LGGVKNITSVSDPVSVVADDILGIRKQTSCFLISRALISSSPSVAVSLSSSKIFLINTYNV